MITEYPFDVPGNYIFDSNKIKVENGEATQEEIKFKDAIIPDVKSRKLFEITSIV